MSSSPKSEKEISSHSSEVLEDVNRHVKNVLDILNRETNRVRKEMEALDEAAKKLEHVHFSKMVKLNVGGHFFSTSLATLNKDPGSMLHAMFSGRFDTKASEDGCYFIDRDGTHFRYILNYLRTGQFIVPKDELVRIREELLAEAEFYQVEGIIEVLKTRAVFMFKDSVILSSDQRETLVTWLKESRAITNDSDKLLYRASRDGWAASNFHSRCDNKGPTVTVIKSGNYIFGGYTDQSWDGSGNFRNAPGSFLFSLVNPSGLPPTKMPLIAGKEGNAIICDSGYGPIFGSGHDLRIPNEPTCNNCSTTLNSSYQCPTGQNPNTFLTGNKSFSVSEMEVFGFDK